MLFPPGPGGRRLGAAMPFGLLLLFAPLLLAGCGSDRSVGDLSRRAKTLWERGQYEDAARAFVAVTEVDPRSALGEESTFWAGCLYQYYLNNPAQATRYYQLLALRFPDGEYVNQAKQNLAEIYEQDPNTVYRALQIYRQLLLAKELSDSQERFQLKVAVLNLQLGRMDQARYELRTFLRKYPRARERAQAYYLVGYSYYMERRPRVAMAVMQQTMKDFPDTPVAAQAQFFMADTQEEQGNLQEALKLFQGLTGKYHNPKIVEKRIQTLEARIRRGVR
jgi:TolA-binding protein